MSVIRLEQQWPSPPRDICNFCCYDFLYYHYNMILLKAVQLWNEISQQQDICWPLTGLVKYEYQRGKNRRITA